jgi:hypothetical protein
MEIIFSKYIEMASSAAASASPAAAAPPSNNWRKSPLTRSPAKSGMLGIGTKGTTDPAKYLKELFTAMRDTDAEKFEDLHARYPLVKAKLDAPKNYKAKTCHVQAAKLGAEALEDLMKFRMGEQRGEPYPQTWQESKAIRDKYVAGFRTIRYGACDEEDEFAALLGEATQTIEIHLGKLWRKEENRRSDEMADRMLGHFQVALAMERKGASLPGNRQYEGSLQQRLDRLTLELPPGSPIGPNEVARLKALGKWGATANMDKAIAAAEENMQKKYGASARGGRHSRSRKSGRKSNRASTRRH